MPMAEDHQNLTSSEEKRVELPNTHTNNDTDAALHAHLDIEF